MKKKTLRQQLIDTILDKEGDEDQTQERVFLETLSTEELQALAQPDDDELPFNNEIF